MITYQVTPFLNNVSLFESFCSFKVGCFTAMKKASRYFSFAIINRRWHQNFPLKNMIRALKEILGWFWIFLWIFMLTSNNISFSFTDVIFLTRVGYGFLLQNGISVKVYGFFSYKGKICLTFFVFQIILKSYFSLVKTFNFFKSCLNALSFLLQNGISIKATGFDSKLLNNLVSLHHARYFQNHLSHYLQISLGILHLNLVFLVIKNWKCKKWKAKKHKREFMQKQKTTPYKI